MTATSTKTTTEAIPSPMRWAFLTTDTPGIGGQIKQQPDDFVVEEIPAYLPSGEGEHLFLWIEKEGVTSEEMVKHLARSLEISHRDIGVAGMKDKQAITRQFVSIPAKHEAELAKVETSAIRILSTKRHRNKLKTGHTNGNKFSILIRQPNDNAEETAQKLFKRFDTDGFPNYFGNQRFGYNGETYKLGFDLLKGEKTPSSIPYNKRRFLLRLALSAAQSYLFNQMLDFRVGAEIFKSVILGDVMQVTASGGLFTVEDLLIITEQFRFEDYETVITGPMYGPKMKVAYGVPAAWEAELLDSHGLSIDDFKKYDNLTPGTRRPYRARPQDVSINSEPDGLRLGFSLPSGVYATTLLRELMKTEV